MHRLATIRVVGSLALITVIASEVFTGIIAFANAANTGLVLGLRILLFISFGMAVVALLSLTYFTRLYVQRIDARARDLAQWIWKPYAVGLLTAGLSSSVSVGALVWLCVDREHMPVSILGEPSTIWLWTCCGTWATAVLLQAVFFSLLASWTRRCLQGPSVPGVEIKFGGLGYPPSMTGVTDELHPPGSPHSAAAYTPQSPSSGYAASSFKSPLSTKTSAANSRTRLTGKSSAWSSTEQVAPLPGEILTLDAFEQWDTSTVHHEMRLALGAAPTISRTALETIPGSRPDSPATTLEGPFQETSSPLRASSPNGARAQEWSSSPPHTQSVLRVPSSPPSSPPNFSRPTSRSKPQTLRVSMDGAHEELVHPLFRSSSPHPPPIATFGTTVTVSPTSRDPLTPRTLATLRNASTQERGRRQLSSSTLQGHWRAMPSVDASSTRPSTAGSTGLGSPGPSIADEEELPPILPGFVLGAGSRSSLIGYSSRKTSKKAQRTSRLSFHE